MRLDCILGTDVFNFAIPARSWHRDNSPSGNRCNLQCDCTISAHSLHPRHPRGNARKATLPPRRPSLTRRPRLTPGNEFTQRNEGVIKDMSFIGLEGTKNKFFEDGLTDQRLPSFSPPD